ncbi:MAG: hypothetical protein R3B70_48320 [Polyangiaceae bacterium]
MISSRPKLVLSLMASLAVSLWSAAALADVPGPREVCDMEDKGCEICWQSYGDSPDDVSAFQKCSEPHTARGLVETCRNRQGAGESVYFCPSGTEPKKTTKGGGCGACTIGDGDLPAGVAAGALAIGLLAALRRRSKKK